MYQDNVIKDTEFASVLLTEGFEIQDFGFIESGVSNEVRFKFDEDKIDEIKKTTKEYRRDQLSVNPRDLFQNKHKLMDMISLAQDTNRTLELEFLNDNSENNNE